VPTARVGALAWLGIQGRTQSLDDGQGVRILAVAPSAPAAQAGITADGDVVIAVDGEGTPRPEDLAATIAKRSVGKTVRLLVCRRGEFRDVMVELQASPGPPHAPGPTDAVTSSRP
jgi:S1-C subfamily serine protease